LLENRAVGAALLAVLITVLYSNTLRNAFVWDDFLTAANAAASPGTLLHPTPGTYYRPVAMLTLAMDRVLWGENPIGFHLTNILCHFAVSWLLLGLCGKLGMPPRPALVASLIFAAHPLQSEAVSYISGRTDILCALFVLLAVRVWLGAQRPFDHRAMGSAGLVLVALLCKETAVLLPLVFLIRQKRGRPPVPVLPLLAAASWLIFFAGTGPGLRFAGVGDRLGAVAGATLTYARLLVWPVGLHLERFTPVEGWSPPATAAAWGLLGIIAAGILRAARGVDGRMLWPALTAATYAPVSGLLPIYPQIADQALFTPEHALYLPLLGLAPLVAGAAARSWLGACPSNAPAAAKGAGAASGVLATPSGDVGHHRRWRASVAAALAPLAPRLLRLAVVGYSDRLLARVRTVLPALFLALLVAWGTVVVDRNGDWRDEETLFSHTLAYQPPVGRVWFNLGNLRLRAGDNAAAVALYREALRRSPNDAAVHFNLGIALQRQGELRGAEAEYARTIATDPEFLAAYRAQAALLATRGEVEAARRVLAEEKRRQHPD